MRPSSIAVRRAAYGFDCAGRAACHRMGGCKAGAYGRVVRVPLRETDRQIFTPTPWGSPSWQHGCNRRSALERINSRIDRVYHMDRHFIRGRAKKARSLVRGPCPKAA